MKPQVKKSKVSKELLESLVIPIDSNFVIVHIPHQNKDTVTENGIIIVGDQDFKPAQHAERWGYIYKLPPNLYYQVGDLNSMQWKTEIECEVGDKVWFDFRAALHAETYECEGEWYKVLYYDNLYLAQRGDELIPLNGYMLLEEFVPPKKHDLLLDTEVDKDYGIVLKAGTPNKEYILDFWDDGIEVNDGDHVLFEKGTTCFPIETELHRELSKDKRVLQHRKRVLAVVDEKHEKILRVHRNVFGVDVNEPELERNGIKLTKDDRRFRVGKVEYSAHPLIEKYSVVVLSKGKGTEFNGLEYFAEDKVYYYETSS